MNFAGVWKVPCVFLCQNNGWAISCPTDKQTASEGFAVKGKAYGVPGVVVDGNDLFAVRQAIGEAAERARSGGGPTIVECHTMRMGGHSTSDDPSRYVPAELLAAWAAKDPVQRFERYLESQGLWSADFGEQVFQEAMEEVGAAAREAQDTPRPALETLFTDVYAELPEHLRRQGQELFELGRRKGDAAAGDGEFPL
jgi:TPP-dependent pyruvate/acetoin dehydrogenase alpha subunit